MGIILSNKKKQVSQVTAPQQQANEPLPVNQFSHETVREEPEGSDHSETQSHKDSEKNQRSNSKHEESSDEEKDGKHNNDDSQSKHSSLSNRSSNSSSNSAHEDEEKLEEEEERQSVDEEEVTEEEAVMDQVVDTLNYEEKVKKALIGDLDFAFPEKVKLVRIFTSSTFTDTSVERNTLMERVYPRLKSFCQERGYDFQVVDMRWGVRDESTDDHMTTELCMKELRACQKLSTGPNFITFLGQKYGYRPFPAKIGATEFEKLLSAVQNDDDLQLLKRWFWRDDNAVPAQYLLQPITSLLPHYRDYENNDLRKKASGEWWSAFERMQVVFRKAADKTLKNRNERQKYYMSVTEDEIRRGVINATEKDKHCFWFKRVITDLREKSGDGNAGNFIDKTWGDPSGVDESAQQLLNQLREKDLPEALTDNNVIQYDVTWHSNGIDPGASQEHASYIEKLCTDFYAILTERINQGINEHKSVNTEDSLTDEIFQHGSFCKRKSQLFHGREVFLYSVQQVFKENRVAVLYGESGCGKTSLMAKIATEVKKWLDKKSATVVLRFIGTTPDSSDVRSLMRSVCQQLIRAHSAEDEENEESAETVPQDIRSLVEFFPKCLEKYATASKPVVLVLDSLDQLSDDDAGRELDWLPRKLPKSVYIALSTLPGERYICLPKLQEKFGDSVLLEVPKMAVDTAKQILDSWLKSSKRVLQSEQEKIVLDAFQKCPLPLYLKLSFDEASRWKSYSRTDDTRLAPSIKGIINELFDRVERLHGKQLVSQALAYITASKNGLTEPELEDILSLDDIVLNDVYQYWTPPIRRLPPLLWIRIRSDIGDYLIERGADDSRVIYWYHRQFVEVARERYLKPERVDSIHLNMSEYFLGKWSNGLKKSFLDTKGTEMSMDRLVSKQPLMFDSNAEKPIFNLRKLSELPHHLLQSNQLEKLKEDTLCNFEFLLAKVQAMSVDAVLQDFNASLALYADDQELELLSKCINLAAHPLRTDPRQLSAQLLGRMHKYLKREGNSNLKRVLQGAQYPSVPAFIPNQQCLTPPGGALVHALANDEFHGGIEFVCFTNDSKTVVTCNRGSEGLCLLFIDIKSGRRQRKVCFDESSTSVNACWRAMISTKNNDIFLAAGSDNNVYLINAKTNKILMEYAPMKDQGNWFRGFPSVEFADNDNLVVALGDAGLRVWETESGKLLHDLPIKGIDVENQFGYFDAQGDLAAYCLFEKKTVHIVNVKTGKEICKINVDLKKEEIQGELKDTKVKEIHLTARKKLLVASEAYIKQELKVYCAATGKHVLDIPDFGMGHSHRLAVTEDGTTAISIRNNYEVVKWDLDTGKAIVAARIQPQFGIYTRKGDFVATASSDGVLGIWDARGTVDDEETEVSATTQGFPDSIWMMVVAADKRHVIASCTVKMMPEIAVWDALTSVKVRSIKAMNFPQPLRMLNDKIGVGRIAVGIPTEKSFDHYKVLDFDNAKAVQVLQGKASKRMEAIGLVGQNHLIGLSRGRRNLKMWDIHTGKVVAQYKLGQGYRIEAFLISEDGSTVVCSQASFFVQHDESTVPLLAFNTKTHEHKELEAVLDEQLTLDYAAITHDGKYLLVQLTNHYQSAIWETQDGRIHRLLGEGSYGRGMVAISSKSMLALTGNTDGNRLMVWKVDSGELLHDFSSAEIDKIYLLQDGTIAVTSDSKAYEPTCLEAWDLIKGKKLTTFTVEINPSTLSPLAGRHITFVAPASVKVMTFRLHIPGYDEEKLGFSSYGAHKELTEFQGMTGPCDLNDKDEDKDDDDSEIMS